MPATVDTAQALETDAAGALPREIARRPSYPRRTVGAVFAAAVLVLLSMAVMSYYVLRQSAERARWVDHTYEVIIAVDKLLLDQQDTAVGERGYLLTGKPEFTEEYLGARARLATDIDSLQQLTSDNPEQQRRIALMRPLNDERLRHLDRLMRKRRSGNELLTSNEIIEVQDSKRVMEMLRSLAGDLIQAEHGLLATRLVDAEQSQDRVQLIIAAGNLLSLGALVICLLLLTREIHARREGEAAVQVLNEAIAERAALLELANKELEGFSYSISHDLRSPLRAIDGFSQLLERSYGGVLDAEGMRLLSVVRGNTRRMSALIEDLLTFSRLGRKSVEMMPLDMRQLVREALNEVLPDAERVPEVVIGELPSCLGDRALVKQVWVNLVSNAVKYSSRELAPRIGIEARRQGDKVVYTVRDNGVGFDMQYYGKLFGVFQRLHGVDEFSGTGVGLAIVMRVVTKHGGQAWAESAVGEGAAFHFSLPCREEAHE
jgi:signal transduction histidine kinase